jgi:L,D-peptidoglycan transpeptidase YkuD (ErfK/YbiS/YcfS/YnhG family)
MEISVVQNNSAATTPRGTINCPGGPFACALGRAGIYQHKREGDGATPAGVFPLRRVLYRPDRGDPPTTLLPVAPISPEDGWCDDPTDAAYNTQVRLPHGGRAERLWRDDHLYDLVVVIGHNDDPVVAGTGSAIFIHVAATNFAATEGCIALDRPDLEHLIALAGPGDVIAISGSVA